ncbi:hypothetical protein F66182_5785 [Fusarium sp. NRRL 66182]|nr:hypothetical protein F66182_5785 [Fusarium sp. NRRL 66182]
MRQSLIISLAAALWPALGAAQALTFESTGNPILADGTVYTADPAPLVVNDTVYILAGRDEADERTNDFVMRQWELYEARNPKPSGGSWTLHQNIARPQDIFSWAQPGGAYASQVVQGKNGKFYLYVSVRERSNAQDPFSIGVAVADKPTGPYKDAHPAGPIISQSAPVSNNFHNIDPTVLVDDDGKAYIYWGSFGQLRGYELDSDMTTVKGQLTTVNTLTGFFEAAWLSKRKNTYYLFYAANNAGPNSPCTPTSYHACIAWGSSSSPLGPWRFGGVVLDIVSSTTSHPGIYELNGQWYMVYHTADARNGGHFRRSVAFDTLEWNDSASPPAPVKVKQTKRPAAAPQPTRNIALKAKASSANQTPIQYWIAALNDGRIKATPLPPDYWSSYNGEQSPETSVLTYTWGGTVRLNGVAVSFFSDQPAGSNIGVPPPASWYAEYLNASGQWTRVAASGAYPTAPSLQPKEVSFTTVSTTSLRITIKASGRSGQFGGVGVHEWFAYAPEAQ